MKKIISFILMILMLTGCSESSDNSFTENPDDNQMNILSVSSPMTFKTEETEFEEGMSIEDIMLSENETYVVAADYKAESKIEFKSGNIKNNEFDIKPSILLDCSYVYDLCSSKDRFFVCYCYENVNYISVFNKLTGELINRTNINLYANTFEIEYEDGYIILSYGLIDENNNNTYKINVYNDSLELIEQDFDINSKIDMSDCMAVSYSKCGDWISAVCFQKETGSIGFVRFSYCNNSYEYFTSDINIHSGYEPVALYGIDENRILFQYCDRDSDITCLNIYDWTSKNITDMYDIKGCEQYIRPSDDNSFVFYSIYNGTIYGYSNSSSEPVKIADESDNYSLIQSFYDYYENRTVIYNEADTKKISVYNVDCNDYNLVTEYNFTEYKKACSLKNGNIAALLNDSQGYRIHISDCNGNLKSEYRLDDLQDQQIELFIVDESENSYIIYNNENEFYINEYNSSGIKTNSVCLKNTVSVYDIYLDNESNVNIYVNGYDGNQIILYKSGTFSVIKLNELMTCNYFEPCRHLYGNDLTFQDIDGIYSYNFNSEAIEKIFDKNAMILNCSLDKCMVYDKDTFIIAGVDYISGKAAICILKRGTDEQAEKTEINVAEIGTHNNNLRKQYRIYNKNSSEYVIKISGYKNQEDFYMAEGKGFVPDIITYEYDSDFNVERFIANGYAEKLNNYIESDKTIASDDYFLSLFQNETSEDIYQIGSRVQIKAMYSEDKVSNHDNWNVFSFTELSEEYGTDILSPVHYTPTYNMILEEILGCYVENNINYQSDCFEADNYVISGLFELSKLYYHKDDNDKNEIKHEKISVLDIYDFSHSYNYKNILTFPVTSPKHQAYLFDKMLISSSSKNKNEAWNIVRTILLDEYQDMIAEEDLCFPVKKSAFYKMADLRRKYEIRNSERILDDEYIDFLYNMLNNSMLCRMPDKMILDSIKDCFDELISNNYSSDEAASKLISVIKKYVKE
ncbi:MAG: membrane lipoprotein lipid attachment site-containing protein [Oscillospiraceae bacterium]|nr:membrane lipoprotein lipid attachment site-containing protein [Oscillospiraceae bacterium]